MNRASMRQPVPFQACAAARNVPSWPTARQVALVLHATPFRLDWPKTARSRQLLPFHASAAALTVGSASP